MKKYIPAIIGIFFILFFGYCHGRQFLRFTAGDNPRRSGAEEVRPEPDSVPANQDLPDYQALAQECKKKLSVECCLASVRAMESGPYRLDAGETFQETTCPDGFEPDMMKCPDSYRWCVPVASSRLRDGDQTIPARK